MKKKKDKNKIIVPVFETNPIAKAEDGDAEDMEKAVKMAKEWVEKNKL